jgi:hypothetical protein
MLSRPSSPSPALQLSSSRRSGSNEQRSSKEPRNSADASGSLCAFGRRGAASPLQAAASTMPHETERPSVAVRAQAAFGPAGPKPHAPCMWAAVESRG